MLISKINFTTLVVLDSCDIPDEFEDEIQEWIIGKPEVVLATASGFVFGVAALVLQSAS